MEEYFSSPDRVIGSVCVCVPVCRENNLWTKWPSAKIFDMIVHFWVKYKGQGRESKFTVTGENKSWARAEEWIVFNNTLHVKMRVWHTEKSVLYGNWGYCELCAVNIFHWRPIPFAWKALIGFASRKPLAICYQHSRVFEHLTTCMPL